MTERPTLAITIGDPAGIGPEVLLKSLTERRLYDFCHPLVIGDAHILAHKSFGTKLKIHPILNPAQAKFKYGVLDVLHLPTVRSFDIPIGKVNANCGELSYLYVEKSVELALAKIVQATVHAPISKEAWQLAGYHYPGHTEMIADLCGLTKVGMAIISEPLRTVMATRHIPISEVKSNLKIENILESVELAFHYLKQLKIRNPKIGVCAMNPHAGEHGILGDEERKVIAPAVKAARKKFGVGVVGPLPADSAFKDHKEGKYDCLITMYHDQSMIPLKLFESKKLVNITLGLPFVRTSPGHGTGFEIAGKNRADPHAMTEAIVMAARMAAV